MCNVPVRARKVGWLVCVRKSIWVGAHSSRLSTKFLSMRLKFNLGSTFGGKTIEICTETHAWVRGNVGMQMGWVHGNHGVLKNDDEK